MNKLSESEINKLTLKAFETEDAVFLDELARTGEWEILTQVAGNKNTSAETLHFLIRGGEDGQNGARGANANVFFAVCKNANLQEGDMWHLLFTYGYGRGLIAHNPSATSKMLDYLVDIGDYFDMKAIAEHENVSVDTLRRLSKMGGIIVPSAVIKSNKVTKEILAFLIKSSENVVVKEKAQEKFKNKFGDEVDG